MKDIFKKINEIRDVLNDPIGETNIEWVKNNINELHTLMTEHHMRYV